MGGKKASNHERRPPQEGPKQNQQGKKIIFSLYSVELLYCPMLRDSYSMPVEKQKMHLVSVVLMRYDDDDDDADDAKNI